MCVQYCFYLKDVSGKTLSPFVYLNQSELLLILMMISEQSSFAEGVLIAEQLWGNITDVNVIFQYLKFCLRSVVTMY